MSDDTALWEAATTRLTIIPGLSWDEWIEKWQTLDLTQRSIPWWIGDALIYAQASFGEAWSQAVDAQYADIYARYVRVSTLIPPSERREGLSWSSHRECAALSSVERAEIFDLAEKQGWRSREIRDEVQRRKNARRGNGGPDMEDGPAQNSTWNAPEDEPDTFGDPLDVEGSPTEAAPMPLQAGNGIAAPGISPEPFEVPAPTADDVRALIEAVRAVAPRLALGDQPRETALLDMRLREVFGQAWKGEPLFNTDRALGTAPAPWFVKLAEAGEFVFGGRKWTVELRKPGTKNQLAIGSAPWLPCAVIEAALSALLSDWRKA